MAIIVTCECGQTFETGDQNAGRQARCPVCGRALVVPQATAYGRPDGLSDYEPMPSYTSGKAVWSLILGLSSVIFCLFTGIPAIILGVVANGEINASKGRLKGSGMATTGIVLGTLGTMWSLVAVLVALLLPAVQSAREAARRSQCVNNLKQIGLAMHNYHSSWNAFPPQASTDENGRPLLSWRVAILPYLEQQALYQQFNLSEPWDGPTNRPLADMMPSVYRCPSDPSLETPSGMTTYEVVVGPHTIFPAPKPRSHAIGMADITDGTSNTVMVGEAARPVHWTEPDDIPVDTTEPYNGFGSKHPGGWNTLFGDGSVRFIKQSISSVILKALLTRDAGEVISSDSY